MISYRAVLANHSHVQLIFGKSMLPKAKVCGWSYLFICVMAAMSLLGKGHRFWLHPPLSHKLASTFVWASIGREKTCPFLCS